MVNSTLLDTSVTFICDQLSLPSPLAMVYLGPPIVVSLKSAFMLGFEKAK